VQLSVATSFPLTGIRLTLAQTRPAVSGWQSAHPRADTLQTSTAPPSAPQLRRRFRSATEPSSVRLPAGVEAVPAPTTLCSGCANAGIRLCKNSMAGTSVWTALLRSDSSVSRSNASYACSGEHVSQASNVVAPTTAIVARSTQGRDQRPGSFLGSAQRKERCHKHRFFDKNHGQLATISVDRLPSTRALAVIATRTPIAAPVAAPVAATAPSATITQSTPRASRAPILRRFTGQQRSP
jgi:hypothetical protein